MQLIAPTKKKPMAPVLTSVGRIVVPPAVQRHRFVMEAQALAMLHADKEDDESRVVGTVNTKAVELYGWGTNVGEHVDNTGFMYAVPLQVDFSVLYARVGKTWLFDQRLAVGEVIRLWDWAVHWTEDRAPVVAAFVGSFEQPCDEQALQLLQAGVDALARGDYYGAPRVAPGCRVLLDDECYATADFSDTHLMLAADALAQKRFILRCAQCTRAAVRLDQYWPYHDENNRCRVHMLERVAKAAIQPEAA